MRNGKWELMSEDVADEGEKNCLRNSSGCRV